MISSRSAGRAPSTEGVLAELVEELGARLRLNPTSDVEAFLREHAEFAERLRPLLPAVMMMAELGRSQSGGVGLSSVIQDYLLFPDQHPTEPDSGVLGDFRIIREIGRGGMGVVYEAEQMSLQRRVALKVLPFAAMLDSRRLQRFHNEAHAAAQLHHANIVPVYSVGCERGVHYYAMQYIVGQTLQTVIADLRRAHGPVRVPDASGKSSVLRLPATRRNGFSGSLQVCDASATHENPQSDVANLKSFADTTRETVESTQTHRLPHEYFRSVAELGIQAAKALNYAHDRGILHRDVKPSNLILDEEGNLWVTDFGLARVEREEDLTVTGDVLGTLRYMSPECASGGAKQQFMDQRVDIYSLGATLYELLTLEPAFPQSDRRELLRRIVDEDPRAPRSIDKAIPVELETIVQKAMAKDASVRYQTALELADDLERYLDDKPITARPPSMLERSRKWAQRHRTFVAAMFAIAFVSMLALIASTATIAAAYRSEFEQRQRAESNFEEAMAAVDQLMTRIGQKQLADTPRMEQLRKEVLEDALQFYQRFLAKRVNDPRVRVETAAATRRVADIYRTLGQRDLADQAYRQATDLLENMAGDPRTGKAQQVLSQIHQGLGRLYVGAGRYDDAEHAYNQAEGLLGDIAQQFPNVVDYQDDLAKTMNDLGSLYLRTDRLQQATEAFQKSLDLLKQLASASPDNPKYPSEIGGRLNNMAMLLTGPESKDLNRACQLLEEAIGYQQRALKLKPNNLQYRAFYRNHLENLAMTHSQLGRNAEAIQALEESTRLSEQLASDFPSVPEYRAELAGSYHNLAGALERAQRLDDAKRLYRQAHQIYEQLISEQPTVPQYQYELAASRSDFALTLISLDQLTEAQENFQKSSELFESLVAKWPNARYQGELAKLDVNFGDLLLDLGHTSGSQAVFSKALAPATQAVAALPQIGDHWQTLGTAHFRNGNWQDAIDALDNAAKLNAGGGEGLFIMAMAYAKLGNKQRARDSYDRAIAWWNESQSERETKRLRHVRAEAEQVLGMGNTNE